MDITNLVAIDVHTHAHVSRHVSEAPGDVEVREAARRYFKHEGDSPTLPEIAAYYRERKMACVVFPVDAESTTGEVRVPNEDVAEAAAENPMSSFLSPVLIPRKGKWECARPAV